MDGTLVRIDRETNHVRHGAHVPYHTLRFQDIYDTLDYALHDDRFLLGVDTVIKRKGGWPMGASLSEPCTMIDLGQSILDCHTSCQHMHSCGWQCPGHQLALDHIVCGALHVDDLGVFSYIFCA
eukprot:1414495-Pyramimonas_sp.AAC.1